VYLVSGEPLARGGSGTQGKISDTAKRKQLVVGFIVIMVIGTFGGDIVVILVTDRYGQKFSKRTNNRFSEVHAQKQRGPIDSVSARMTPGAKHPKDTWNPCRAGKLRETAPFTSDV